MKTVLIVVLMALLVFPVYAQNVPTTLSELNNGKIVFDNTPYTGRVEGSWTQGLNMPFPRYYAGSVAYTRNDTLWLYVFGGDTTGNGHATTGCLRYNVNTNTWEYIAPLPLPMRINAAVRIGDKLYTMGGFSAPFPAPAITVFYEYNVNTNTWRQLPDLPRPVFFHGAVSFEDSLIYILGGISDVAVRGDFWLKTVIKFNIDDENFEEATELPEATAGFGYSISGKDIFVVGGLRNTTQLWNFTFRGEINLSDRKEINWQLKANYSLSLYGHYAATFPNREIYYSGGSITTGFAPVANTYEYKINEDAYIRVNDSPLPWMATSAGVNFMNQESGQEIVILVASGGITTGPSITAQTWIFTDTVDVMGLNEIDDVIPADYNLYQNYPNPFNPSTTIRFAIPKESFTMLEIFNAIGENISTLVSENLSAGSYSYYWDAGNLPSGIYFYRLLSADFVQTKKLLLMK